MNLYSNAKLSPREIQVCVLLLTGMSYQEIATHTCIAYKTAVEYKRRAFKKLGVRNRAELQRLKISAMLEDVPPIPNQWQAGYRSALQEILQ